MSIVQLAPQQREALDAIEQWWEHGADEIGQKQIFRLFGYAGTGKTTIAKLVPELLGLVGRVRFAAYTGKAAHVLARKGCSPVSTIHSMIYHPVEVVSECPYGDVCEARDEDKGTCAHMIKSLEFVLKDSIEPTERYDADDPDEWDEAEHARTHSTRASVSVVLADARGW